MKHLIVIVGITIASFIWRFLFWKYTTSKKTNKSWTLLPAEEVKSFLNSSTVSVCLVWLVTYSIYLLTNMPSVETNFQIFGKIALRIIFLVGSIIYPTLCINDDLNYQIKQQFKNT